MCAELWYSKRGSVSGSRLWRSTSLGCSPLKPTPTEPGTSTDCLRLYRSILGYLRCRAIRAGRPSLWCLPL